MFKNLVKSLLITILIAMICIALVESFCGCSSPTESKKVIKKTPPETSIKVEVDVPYESFLAFDNDLTRGHILLSTNFNATKNYNYGYQAEDETLYRGYAGGYNYPENNLYKVETEFLISRIDTNFVILKLHFTKFRNNDPANRPIKYNVAYIKIYINH